MFKKGDIEIDHLGYILIALAFLVVVLLIIFAFQGKGLDLIDKLKSVIGGPR